MSSFEIWDDSLIREEQAYSCEGGVSYCKRIRVITKEEFIACYKEWIESEEKKDKFVKVDDLNKAIKLIQGIEEDGRNVTFERVDALNIAIKALEFIDENCPKTFIDYLNGEQI